MKKLIIAFMLLAPVAVFAQKFGYVETQRILAVHPEARKMNEDLQKMTKQKQDELDAKQKVFKQKFDMYEKEKTSMSESERNQKGDALKQEYDSFQKEYYAFQEELENKQKEMMGRLYLKIKDAIKKVGDAGNYTFIFEQQTPLYYGKNAEDVTIKVMKEMDNIK